MSAPDYHPPGYHVAYYARTRERRRHVAREAARRRRERGQKGNEARWWQWLVLRTLVELGRP